jgi:hypothetical protein
MTETYNFKNQILMRLYETVNSSIVANIKTVDAIHAVLYPYIRAVIDDKEAYEEGISSGWQPFKAIKDHVEGYNTGYKDFLRMDQNTSMSFSLFMYIYH